MGGCFYHSTFMTQQHLPARLVRLILERETLALWSAGISGCLAAYTAADCFTACEPQGVTVQRFPGWQLAATPSQMQHVANRLHI